MIDEIKKLFNEYENGNYESALKILDNLDVDDDSLMVVEYACFMGLKKFDEALKVIESLEELCPEYEFVLFDKVRCQYFSDDKSGAIDTLKKLESGVDETDIENMIKIADLYNLVGEYELSLKYCELALAIDENNFEAINIKSRNGIRLKKDEVVNECADKLIKEDGETIDLLFPFMLKMFSGNFNDCIDIINRIDANEEESIEMFKIALYNQMQEDLEVKLAFINQETDISVDLALELMFKYYNGGVDSGEVNGVKYMIFNFD